MKWPETASLADSPEWLAVACRKYTDEFRSGKPARIEDYLAATPELQRATLFLRLYQLDMRLRREPGGSTATHVDYAKCFPEYAHLVVGEHDSIGSVECHGSTATAAAGESVELIQDLAKAPSLAPPSVLKEYRLLEYLGGGTYGEVWKALHPTLNRVVAVKILRHKHSADARIRNSFVEEGRKLGVLNGIGVVQVFDAGQEDNWHFLVSEFVEGGDLSKLMARKTLTPDAAARLVADIALALHRAHSLQIVHRDIKPQNILLDRDGRPKLADFGLAATDVEQQRERGGVMGTAVYMAPELVRGESHWADSRTDIYALGVVLYQMLTGKLPFRGRDRAETYHQILERPAPPLRTLNESISPALEAICLKCLAKDPAERFTTARDLERALRHCTARRPMPWAKIIAAGTVVIFLAILASWRPWQNASSQNPAAVGVLIPAEGTSVGEQWTLGLGTAAEVLSPPGKVHTVDMHFSREIDGLSVATAASALVQLGKLDIGETPQFSYGVDITEPDLHGGSGIFIGYHPGPCSIQGEPSAGHMQAFWLSKHGNNGEKPEYRVRRWRTEIDPRNGNLLESETLGWERVEFPSSHLAARLQIDISEGLVVRVLWNGKALSKLTSDYANSRLDASYYNGPFGVFTQGGTAWFRNPTVTRSPPTTP
jgi:serine/threonine protein kinase